MKQMEHLSPEGLVAMYYNDEAPDLAKSAQKHVAECADCAAAYRNLEDDLKALGTLDAPERGEDYGERMWQRVAAELPAAAGLTAPAGSPAALRLRSAVLRPGRKWRSWMWMGLSYATGCAVLATAAFYVGTVWEHQQHLKREAAREAERKPGAPEKPRVVVVVLGDHLDRSERLLVELKHADADNQELVKPLRDEARGLLAANHVFREDADKSGDGALSQALDKLDKLLREIANEPGGLNKASLERLQQEMTNEGLLFEVRVLRSRHPYRDTAIRVVANGGTA
jgi:hypothetical protein